MDSAIPHTKSYMQEVKFSQEPDLVRGSIQDVFQILPVPTGWDRKEIASFWVRVIWYVERDGHDWQCIAHALKCGLTKVILYSLKLLGCCYWRVHMEGVNSACLDLMSWGLTVLGALLLLLQPGDAGPCCCYCVLREYRNMRTGENRCRGPRLAVRARDYALCTFSYQHVSWSWPKPFSGMFFLLDNAPLLTSENSVGRY